jgi:hypothetical protein
MNASSESASPSLSGAFPLHAFRLMNNGRENEKKFLEGELEERRGSGRASINSAGRFFLEGLFLKGNGIENFRFEDGFSDSGTSEGW